MNNYYMNFIIHKIKTDIYEELSENSSQKKIIKKCIDKYFDSNKILFEKEEEEEEEYNTHKFRERELYANKKNKCIARIWNEGYGGQCSCKGNKEYNDYCLTHYKKGGEKDEWWLGRMDELRPERPIHPKYGLHHWKNNAINQK